MIKELIYREDALEQLRLNDKDVIYIDKQEAAERIKKLNAMLKKMNCFCGCFFLTVSFL